MKYESRQLANVLLRRHRAICQPLRRSGPTDVDDQDIKDSIIPYGDLCEFANLPRSYAHPSGNFLIEIAEWCNESGWPPLNAWRSTQKRVIRVTAIAKRPAAMTGISM
jgi:hypothetical protein